MQADQVLDAVRESDGEVVVLKRIRRSVHPHEVPIAQYLCSSPLSDDPRNHCCPVLDVLDDPIDDNIQIMAMPLLRRYNNPEMQTVGEAVSFFRQAFEVHLLVHARRNLC